jgi:hypothetical protein
MQTKMVSLSRQSNDGYVHLVFIAKPLVESVPREQTHSLLFVKRF